MPVLILLAVFALPPIVQSTYADEAPTQMEAVHVDAAPFGYIGIKHATAKLSVLRLLTFRGSLEWLQVDEQFSDSPGWAAGIHNGDRIIRINGKPIQQWSMSKLKAFGATVEVGQHLAVEVVRPSDQSKAVCDVVITRKPRPIAK